MKILVSCLLIFAIAGVEADIRHSLIETHTAKIPLPGDLRRGRIMSLCNGVIDSKIQKVWWGDRFLGNALWMDVFSVGEKHVAFLNWRFEKDENDECDKGNIRGWELIDINSGSAHLVNPKGFDPWFSSPAWHGHQMAYWKMKCVEGEDCLPDHTIISLCVYDVLNTAIIVEHELISAIEPLATDWMGPSPKWLDGQVVFKRQEKTWIVDLPKLDKK